MSTSEVLLVMAVTFVLWGSIAAARMGSELSRRGERVRWVLMRIDMLRWVGRYRELTTADGGRPGSLYRQFTIAMPTALVLAAIALVLRR